MYKLTDEQINYIIEEVRNEKLKQELLNGMMEV